MNASGWRRSPLGGSLITISRPFPLNGFISRYIFRTALSSPPSSSLRRNIYVTSNWLRARYRAGVHFYREHVELASIVRYVRSPSVGTVAARYSVSFLGVVYRRAAAV